jgi:hypothetical protein
MMAYGFEVAMLGKLVLDGFALATPHDTRAGRQPIWVVWMTRSPRPAGTRSGNEKSRRLEVLAPSSVPEFRPLTQRACGGWCNPGGCHGAMAAFLHRA